ncbi:hypothetical protein [Actinokineospora iranica]|uniref:hypothetical protein n=1 Tax=Actinokineospora iranica TaxID=1271860 RepID=UPI001113844B|nr:hypothetical protein [Actinokineospora iranica]
MRSPAALDRLEDIAPLLLRDRRLEVWFTIAPGSRFSGGLSKRLSDAGALLLSWENVDQRRFDLIVAASENSDFARLRGPIVLLPHGAGYHRHSPHDRQWPSGLSKTALIQNDHVLPTTIVVADADQLDVMRSVDPRLPAHALVAGDPCLDRLRASRPHRELHRRAYQADGRHLVLLCSTWGPNSLYGHRPDFAERLVTHLPADEYRVVLTLHPNIWELHGPLQVNAWLRPAVTAGLVVVPPTRDWRPALLAADLVVSDHGSLTFYAAALGLPTLIAADGADEVVAHSPMADLIARLPRLTDADRTEIARALRAPDATPHRPPTLDVLIGHLYSLLGLPDDSDAPVPPAVPVPDTEVPAPPHFQIKVIAARRHGDSAEITLERTTARWRADGSFLTAAEHCADLALLERAGAIYAEHPHARADTAAARARNLRETFPGARVALVSIDETRVAVAVDNGTSVARTTAPVSATAAALHWWSTIPLPERPTTIHVRAGTVTGVVTTDADPMA